MKLVPLLPMVAPVALVCSCSGIMPGVGILAPSDLTSHQMDYSDLDGSYEYRFLPGEKYVVNSRMLNGSARTSRSGKWEWDRKDYDKAVLTLDGAKTLDLHFTTKDHANGTFEGESELYAFEFTEL